MMGWYDYLFGGFLIALFGFMTISLVVVGMNEREDDENEDSRNHRR